jgi:cytochrome c oxidase subunit 3/cytochrome o ubiquinol oxidase subunit 3
MSKAPTPPVSEQGVRSTASSLPVPPPIPLGAPSDPHKVGMVCFLISESAFFCTLILAYVVFIGKSQSGPKPADVLQLPLVFGTTACLLLSSLTVHFADRSLRHGDGKSFPALWAATIVLGVLFLAGTAYEWTDLIGRRGLTIATNLFGTTYYTLVGFHAAHVTMGVVMLTVVLLLALKRRVTAQNPLGVELVSWYWHFVDVVWVVVFTIVYLIGR